MRTVIITVCCYCAVAALILNACKKKDEGGNGGVSYRQLGNISVNRIIGFGMNGDPIARNGDGQVIRYRQSSGDWEHVGTLSGLSFPDVFDGVSEDAAGNYYGYALRSGVMMLPAGTTAWIKMQPPVDSVTLQYPPVGNSTGALVWQCNHSRGGVNYLRIYRREAGSSVWNLACERPDDKLQISALADNGDAFLATNYAPLLSYNCQVSDVLPAGANAVLPIVDCISGTVKAYCNMLSTANRSGEVFYYNGGLGSHTLYRMRATQTYPALAETMFDFPAGDKGDNCCFTSVPILSPDGTAIVRLNNGTYDLTHVYIRKSGADSWYDASQLPADDGSHSVDLVSNGKGDVFTYSISLGAVQSTGPVYQMQY